MPVPTMPVPTMQCRPPSRWKLTMVICSYDLVVSEFHSVPTLEGGRKTLLGWAMIIHALTTVVFAFLFCSSVGRKRSREGISQRLAWGEVCSWWSQAQRGPPTPGHQCVHFNDSQEPSFNILGNSVIVYRNQEHGSFDIYALGFTWILSWCFSTVLLWTTKLLSGQRLQKCCRVHLCCTH